MIQREIKTIDGGGGVYSDQVTVFYQDQDQPGRSIVFHCNPDGLYSIIHTAVASMTSFGASSAAASPEEKEKTALAKLLKVAIKGLLLMYGPRILDAVFGSKDHPKPQKGDDLLEWYQDIFTKLGIAYLMKNDTVLTGRVVDGSIDQAVIGVGSITTRPVTASESQEGAGIATGSKSVGGQVENVAAGLSQAGQ